ncbi:MAG: polysaccharide deacetylase family protein [Bacilli bacterium]|nr:MAG: polysaccharide deacetylase family protein [Bacilli bacterium]
MKELEMYIDKKLQLPQKSVVITFDDGGRAEVAKKYVDEYKINATLFLITSWFKKRTI